MSNAIIIMLVLPTRTLQHDFNDSLRIYVYGVHVNSLRPSDAYMRQ